VHTWTWIFLEEDLRRRRLVSSRSRAALRFLSHWVRWTWIRVITSGRDGATRVTAEKWPFGWFSAALLAHTSR
jgi:hypothetical protein